MESLIYDSGASVQQLLDTGFEMPIHFAAVGTNGSVVAGTFRFSQDGQGFDCQITAQNSKPKSSRVPSQCGDLSSRLSTNRMASTIWVDEPAPRNFL